MCGPVAAGMAIGAATGALGSAITGGDPLQGALMVVVVVVVLVDRKSVV